MIERARKHYSELPGDSKYQALDLLDKKAKQAVQPNPILQPPPLKQE